ncbi:MAG TPA: DUF1444 family protein [Roseiflexaceae bacterium]|nr:DUF1444 family protein [Roseiflexaceae bacterium]
MTNGNGHDRTNGDSANAFMSPAQFAIYMEKRLTLEDAIEALGHDGLLLRVRANGVEQTADLANFYTAYTHHPERLDTIVHNFVETVLGIVPNRDVGDFAMLSERIYPMIKPLDLLVKVREHNLPMLAYREFLAGLMIAYVIDEQRSVTFINETHLENWEVDVGEVHKHAIKNLRRRTVEQVDYVVVGEGEQRIYIYNSGDGYDATRLLLSDVLTSWARDVPGALVIGIPNRDFLIGFSDSNPDILERIAQQVQADAAGREYSITDQLFTLDGGEVREYVWE